MRTNQFLSRRSVLKTVGAGSATLFGTGVVGAGKPTVEIITERLKNGEVVTKKVPRAWYEYEQRVDHAHEVAEKQYGSHEAIKSVHITPSQESRGGIRVSKVEIARKPSPVTDSLHFPSEIEGIPVSTSVLGEDSGGSSNCPHYGDTYDAIKGGVSFYGDGGFGSLGCRVTYDGKTCFLTANHVFGSCGANIGDVAIQGGDVIGEVIGYNATYDWAVIEDQTSKTFTDYIVNPNTSGLLPSGDLEVAGYFTEAGARYVMDQALPVWRQGRATNQQIGHIYHMKYNFDWECVDMPNGIYTACDNADGDSGGPTFAETDSEYGEVSMLGIHIGYNKLEADGTVCGGLTNYESSISTPAFDLVDYGIDFEEAHFSP